jgi:hypothetical protein
VGQTSVLPLWLARAYAFTDRYQFSGNCAA